MKKALLLSTLLVLSIAPLSAQSPGGVGQANLTAWFNPDNLPIGNVTSWISTYPVGASAITLNDVVAPHPIATNTPAGNTANYNTTIDFTGNGTGNLASTNARALVTLGNLDLLDNRVATSQGTMFASYFMKDSITAGGQHILDFRESIGDAIQFRYFNPSNTKLAIGTTGPSTNAARQVMDNGSTSVFSYHGNRSSATSLFSRQRSLEVSTTGGATQAGTGGTVGLTVGARRNNNGTYGASMRSFINEIIFFNTDLNIADLIRVESYLALKYGVTLDPAGVSMGGYLTTSSLAAWTTTLPYHNDIIGIARDDNTLLNQKQSHSFDDSLRIYLGALAASNVGNASTFANDISYVLIGHDLGQSNETATATAEMPAGQNLLNRIDREWRVQNTNSTETYSIDITLDNFTNFSNSPGDLALLVDDDGNFSNASVFQAGLTFSVSGNVVTVSGISPTQIPTNSFRYITLATITTPTPVQLKSFNAELNNKFVRLNWDVSTEENFDYYSIERSQELSTWKEIGQVAGKGSESNYVFIDENPIIGDNYYRLNMIDIDAKSAYSWNSQVNLTADDVVKIYPNPVTKNTLWIEANNKTLHQLSIWNLMGQEVKNQIQQSFITEHYMRLDLSKVPNGLYFIKLGKRSYSILK